MTRKIHNTITGHFFSHPHPQQSAKTKAFQARFDTLRTSFIRNEINAQELLSMLLGEKNELLLYCEFSLSFFLN
jgi:hypothetical protein